MATSTLPAKLGPSAVALTAGAETVVLLEADPVFAALTLRAASTANFGGQPSTSLDQAVNRLGINAVRTLLVQAAARSIFECSDRAINQRMAQVWTHSVGVAVMGVGNTLGFDPGMVAGAVVSGGGATMVHVCTAGDSHQPVRTVFLLRFFSEVFPECVFD